MPSNYLKDDPILGQVDLDDYFVTDAWLVDQFVGNGLWSWGGNVYGGLGLGDLVHRSSPVQVGQLSNWKQVAGGSAGISSSTNSFRAAIKSDGTLWTWGNNFYGYLGLGDTTSRSSPVQVGTLTNWKMVACGGYHSAAIKTDGTLWTWGGGPFNITQGALGLGDTTGRSSPVQVGSLTNWKMVACGVYYSVAIKTDGTLWAWGHNTYSALGLGDLAHRSSPVQVGTLTNWKMVSCSATANRRSLNAAIKTDGTLWTWGLNNFGGLGLGDLTDRSSPVQVGTLTNWKMVSCGNYFASAIKTDGTLWTWGSNDSGNLGLNNTTLYSSPVQVGSLTNWKMVSCGGYSIAAIKTDGTLWAWGDNSNGVLGLNDTTLRSSPVQVGTLTNWKQINVAVGNSATSARMAAIAYADIT